MSQVVVSGWARLTGTTDGPVRRVESRELGQARLRRPRAVRAVDRACKLVLRVAGKALEHAGMEPVQEIRARAGMILGTAFGCLESNEEFMQGLLQDGARLVSPRLFSLTVPNAPQGVVSIEHGLGGPAATVLAGGSSGSAALGFGLDLLRAGQASWLVCGAYETLAPGFLETLDQIGLGGSFVPTEGAALVVLETRESVLGRGGTPCGLLAGAGFARGTGTALARAWVAALHDAGRRPEELVGWLPGLGRWSALRQMEGEARQWLPLEAPAGDPPRQRFGETFGAAGALAASVALEAFQSGSLQGPVLVSDPSWDGCHGALVLEPWREEP